MKALLFLSALLVQTASPVFEVASVRPSASVTTGSSVQIGNIPKALLQGLLAERFKLVFHCEPGRFPVMR
jgi:hypothetical protein